MGANLVGPYKKKTFGHQDRDAGRSRIKIGVMLSQA